MFREKAILKVAKEVSDGVIVANNMKASVVAKGNVTIKASSGDATDVLCIPELTMNLWSMHKVCSRGHRVVFYKEGFWMGLWHLYMHSLKQLRNMVRTWCEARRIRYFGLHFVLKCPTQCIRLRVRDSSLTHFPWENCQKNANLDGTDAMCSRLKASLGLAMVVC